MISRDNREELAWAYGKYLLAARMASISEVKHEVIGKRGKYNVIQDNLHAKELISGDSEYRRCYILCYNPKEAKRQKKHRAEIVRLLEKDQDQNVANPPSSLAADRDSCEDLRTRPSSKGVGGTAL